MPVRQAKTTASSEYPNKRPRLSTATTTKGGSKATTTSSKPKFTFTNASQIRASLKNDNFETLTETLTSLRNQLNVRPQEGTEVPIAPQDERLVLVRAWMETSPGAQDLFGVWDKVAPSTMSSGSRSPSSVSLLSPTLSALSSILALLSAHYTDHALGQPILKTLLSPQRLRQLNSFLGGANNELVLVTLRLYNAMSAWAGGRDRKAVLEGFGWEIKSLPKLLNMRRKTHGEKDTTDPLIRPDIRTLYVLLLLSFIAPDTPSQLKTFFLEHHRAAFQGIFKGLKDDHYTLARRVLEVCWSGLWGDARVRRTVKVGVFGEMVLGCLVKLYDRTTPENGEEDHIPADLVHHFLLAICTRPGQGICFKDRGWYPRASEADADEGLLAVGSTTTTVIGLQGREEDDKQEGGGEVVVEEEAEADDGEVGRKGKGRGGRIYNKILTNFVKTLKVNEDARQQELVLKILGACPELVAGYWSAVGLTLEPRLSSKWITNIAVFGNIISLPVPSECFLLPGTNASIAQALFSQQHQKQDDTNANTNYNPTPPPLYTILENILPSATSTKHTFTKGLQPPTPLLVQHCTALALCRCLKKFDAVVREMQRVSEALEEDEEAGQWAQRKREVEREVRRRVPDWGVCVAFAVAMGIGVGSGAQSGTDQQASKEQENGKGKAKEKEEGQNSPDAGKVTAPVNKTKMALLAESAQRLLWLYHRCLPAVVAEVRFDVGKLLQAFVRNPTTLAGAQTENEDGQEAKEDDEEDEHEPDAAARLYRVQQLHILALLKESDQFVWSSKIPSLSQTPLHVLVTALTSSAYAATPENSSSASAIRSAITVVLQHILSQSILFLEDADEPELWFRALPRKRPGDVGGKGGKIFEGESECVVSFLDECVQRCLKTPYKYVEALHSLFHQTSSCDSGSTSNSTSNSNPSSRTNSSAGADTSSTNWVLLSPGMDLKQLPSPLVMTLLEQLEAKVNGHLLLPSHVVGIAVFIRKLLFHLASKTVSAAQEEGKGRGVLALLRELAGRADQILSVERISMLEKNTEKSAELLEVVRREVELTRACLAFDPVAVPTPEIESRAKTSGPDRDLGAYLNEIEQAPIPHSKRLQNAQALSIIDFIRTSPSSSTSLLTTSDLSRAVKRILGLVPALLSDLIENVPPGTLGADLDVWDALGLPDGFEDLKRSVDSPFPYLLLHATAKHLVDEKCQAVLAHSIFSLSPSLSGSPQSKAKLVDIIRSINLVTHHLSSLPLSQQGEKRDGDNAKLVKNLLFLLTKMMEASREALGLEDMLKLKESVFSRSSVLKDLMMTAHFESDEIIEGVQRLIAALIDPTSESDRVLVEDISGFWFNVLATTTPEEGMREHRSTAAIPTACLWIKFLPPSRLFDLLDVLLSQAQKQNRQDALARKRGVSSTVPLTTAQCQVIKSVLESICIVCASVPASDNANEGAELMVLEKLPVLLSLRSILAGTPSGLDSDLEKTIAIAIEASLPIGVDGCSSSFAPVDVVGISKRADGRFARRRRGFAAIDIGVSRTIEGGADTDMDIDAEVGMGANAGLGLELRSFLMKPSYSIWTVKIICGLIYRAQCSSPSSESNSESSLREIFLGWAKSSNDHGSAERVLPILWAFLDSLTLDCEANGAVETSAEIWAPPFIPIIVKTLADPDVEMDLQRYARSCLIAIVSICAAAESSSTSHVDALLDILMKEIQSLPEKQATAALLSAGTELASKFKHKFGPISNSSNPVVSALVDRGMQACIEQFGDALETVESSKLAEALTLLLRRTFIAKTHMVETLLTVIIQSRFWNIPALQLAIACLSACQLKPVVVNRHLQSIIQHPHFFKICSSSSPEHAENRDALVELLHRLFNLHPTNTCQISHIEPLIRIYRGTLSQADLRILSVFQLFESQKKLSVTPLLSRWSANASTTSQSQSSSQTALEGIQSLDPILVLRTCLNFPRWRHLEDQSEVVVASAAPQEAVLYDPVFLMLLFSQMVESGQMPTSAFGWIELFRTNVVSLFVRALAAKDGQVRHLALSQVVALWKMLETADLQEKPHVVYILNMLKDLMPAPDSNHPTLDSEYPRRLPTYTALLLMHSLRAVFHPSNFIYPITARFLLQRPSLDVTDVPMLYGLLYSSSDDNWKKERAWIIKFLADGMVGSEDWRVLRRRHTWDLLASLFQSAHEGRDGALRMGILEVLANLTCNAQATTSLLLKSALLQWIETQLLYSSSAKPEGVEWIKILENIIVIVDAGKIEAATDGVWRSIICRCLGYLLDENNCATASANFPHTVPVILRLAALPGSALWELPSLLDLAVASLEKMEAAIPTSDLQIRENPSVEEEDIILSPPHRSLTLHQRILDTKPSRHSNQTTLYWTLLRILWKASMLTDATRSAWEKLTPRVLLWGTAGSMIDESSSFNVAEWARKEVVRNLKIG